MSFITLSDGSKFYYNALEYNRYKIEVIALALSHISRFCGHTKEFYSVAQHSILVSNIVRDECKLHALLHDAAEAFICDIPTPLKNMLPDYKAFETELEKIIFNKFNVTTFNDEVKNADLVLLATEKRDILNDNYSSWDILKGVKPLPYKIKPITSNKACQLFIEQYKKLKGE